jgi:hypothetical protein
MRERYATCGREVNSTVFANDMAEEMGVCLVLRLGQVVAGVTLVTCDMSRQGSVEHARIGFHIKLSPDSIPRSTDDTSFYYTLFYNPQFRL